MLLSFFQRSETSFVGIRMSGHLFSIAMYKGKYSEIFDPWMQELTRIVIFEKYLKPVIYFWTGNQAKFPFQVFLLNLYTIKKKCCNIIQVL